jgi:SnoaL-like domain
MSLSVEDRLAINDLVALHGHLMDGGELARMDELFSADVVYDLEDFGIGTLHGIAAIRDAAVAVGERNPLAHHVTNVVVTASDGDTVRVLSKGLAVNVDGSAGSVVYADVIRRESAGWRICNRKVKARRTPLSP